jgi:hypothetical protein
VVAMLAHPPAPALLKPPVSHRPPCVPPCPLRAQACRAGAAGVKLLDGGGNPVAAAALIGRSVPVAGPRIAVARGAGRSGRGPLCARCAPLVHTGARSFERGRGRVPAATEPVHGTDRWDPGGGGILVPRTGRYYISHEYTWQCAYSAAAGAIV